MKILIVEDERKTTAYLKRGFEENGFSVDVAYNGEDGAHLAGTRSHDLIILEALELTPKEFQLLSLLLRQTGDVLSRTLIAEEVWDINFESDSNAVEVHMRRLHAKVDNPFNCKLIHTVRGVGYVLEQRA